MAERTLDGFFNSRNRDIEPDEEMVDRVYQSYNPSAQEEVQYSETLRQPQTSNEGQPTQYFRKPSAGDYLQYLAPLVAGAFAGDLGYAAKVTGSQILKDQEKAEKKRDDLQSRLASLQMKRKLTPVKTPNKQRVSLRNKKTLEDTIGFIDPVSLEAFDASGNKLNLQDYKLASGMDINEYVQRLEQLPRKDPTTEQYGTIKNLRSGGEFVPIQGSASQQLTVKQEKVRDKISTDLIKSKEFTKNVEALTNASQVDLLLESAVNDLNPTAAAAARKTLAGMLEPGKLTDEDVKMVQGDPSYLGWLDRKRNTEIQRMPFTPEDLKYFKMTADILAGKYSKRINSSVNKAEKDFIKNGGVPGYIKSRVSPYIPEWTPKKVDISKMDKTKDKIPSSTKIRVIDTKTNTAGSMLLEKFNEASKKAPGRFKRVQ